MFSAGKSAAQTVRHNLYHSCQYQLSLEVICSFSLALCKPCKRLEVLLRLGQVVAVVPLCRTWKS